MIEKFIMLCFLWLHFCLTLLPFSRFKVVSNRQPLSYSCPVSTAMAADSLDLLCRSGQAVELLPMDTDGDGIPDEGGWPLWADEMVDAVLIQCGEGLVFSINREGDTPDGAAEVLILKCGDVPFAIFEVHAWCGGEIVGSCTTYAGVFDNFGLCGHPPPPVAVDGRILREDGVPVEGVTVSLSGPSPSTTLTSVEGNYHLLGVLEGEEVTITPEKNAGYAEGVSTLDMVLISRHILGVEILGSPYQLIAADVNNSRYVTTLDLIALRRLLLGIDIEFEVNTSWRFVESDYAFPNPANPWQERFPEWTIISPFPATGVSDLDFVAVKVGDVSLD